MSNQVDLKRVNIFLLLAFGISWGVALIIFLTGGIAESPVIIDAPPVTISLAFILIATVYMWSPAVAHLLTRILTREGWAATGLRPNLRRGWRYWLVAWLLPFVLIVLGIVIYFAAFPRFFDPSLPVIQAELDAAAESTGQPIPFSPWMVVVINTLAALLIAPFINGVFTFGEEFGWRAYLQPKLMPLGGRKAMLLMGIIWGVWHWPVIAMGHNYGLGYPGAPWLGLAAMTLFTLTVGTLLGWVTFRAGSVWPAVIGHGIINGTAALGLLFLAEPPDLLIGPAATGIVGGIPFALFALWVLLSPGALEPIEQENEALPSNGEVGIDSARDGA